jgi:hypothetical protein
MRGMTEKASRGEPTGPPPFGYIMRDGKYYPDEESGKADIVREVFTLYANGVKQREIALVLANKGIRTKFGKAPESRWVDYMLHNNCYIGKIRFTPDGTRAVSQGKLDNENIMIADGHHEPLISMELWDKVQTMLENQRKSYPKYARQSQPIDHMLKGLIRCDCCGGALAINGWSSGKNPVRNLQCCNYARGSCRVSHSITLPRLEGAFIAGLKQAVESKQFTLAPKVQKKSDPTAIDFDKLIAVEERRLERAKDAYLAEIDTIEQYKQNKMEITDRINDLIARRDKETEKEFNIDEFTAKVMEIVEFIDREDVTPAAKNEALHTIIEKVVYEKAKGNLAIFFHDI